MCFSSLPKKLIFNLLFYSIVFISPAFCQIMESNGYLKIDSDSSRIEIRLDDRSLGYTPLPVISLSSGDHVVAALNPNPFIWGNLDWQDSIKITSNDTVIVRPEFKTIFYIQTNPFDAEVFLNNKLTGNTPLTISINPKHKEQLLFKKTGFKDYLVNLNQVKNNYLNINLIQNQVQLNLDEFEHQQLSRSKNHYRLATYSLWGLSILTGLTTVYLKDQADNRYQQYLVAGSLTDMNKYYNDAKRFDRYTYISLGALQGCFLLSFYFLMKSL